MNWHEILDGGIGGLVVAIISYFFCRGGRQQQKGQYEK